MSRLYTICYLVLLLPLVALSVWIFWMLVSGDGPIFTQGGHMEPVTTPLGAVFYLVVLVHFIALGLSTFLPRVARYSLWYWITGALILSAMMADIFFKPKDTDDYDDYHIGLIMTGWMTVLMVMALVGVIASFRRRPLTRAP